MWPFSTKFKTSVDAIALDVIKSWGADDMAQLRSIDRESMVKYHSTIGRFIRNEYKMWDVKNPLTKQWAIDEPMLVDGVNVHQNHPDNISMAVLYKLWDIAHECN